MSARSSIQPYGPQVLNGNAQTVGPVDTADFEFIAIQFTAAITGVIAFEQSLDGASWSPCALQNLASVGTSIISSIGNPSANAIFYGPCPGRFFRARTTAYTSGSSPVLILPIEGGIPQLAFNNSVSGSVTPTDGQANPTTAVIDQAMNSFFNNVQWDRARNAQGTVGGGTNQYALSVASGSYVRTSHAAATTTGAGSNTDNLLARKDHSLHVTGTGVGFSVTLEGSLDGTNFFQLPLTATTGGGGTVVTNAATSNGFYTATGAVKMIRANITAIASGAITTNIVSA